MTEPGPRPDAPYGDFQLEYLAGAEVSFSSFGGTGQTYSAFRGLY